MPSSSSYQIGIAKQTAKGVPAAAPAYVFDVTASDLAISREGSTREETGQGRDPGEWVANRLATGGGFTVLARPTLLGLLYYGALGAKAVTGASAPYTHTLTAADDQPYFTIWDRRFTGPESIVREFQDCKLTGLNLTGSPGGDLSAQSGVVGGKIVPRASMPAGGVYVTDLPLRVPRRSIDAGVESDSVGEFGVNLTAGINTQQTSQLYDSYHEPGGRTVEVTFTSVFESKDLYEEIYYGGVGGTELSARNKEAECEMTFEDEEGVEGLTLTIPRLLYTGADTSVSTSEDIAMYSITGQAARPASGPIMTAAVKNSVAAY